MTFALTCDLVVSWDADALRDEVRVYVIEHLGSSDGVLIADDTQARKKGDKSAVPVDLPLLDVRGGARRPDQVFTELGVAAWERRSCGAGSKGQRFYDWGSWPVRVKDQPPADGCAHTLLIHRSLSDPDDIEFFLAHAPAGTPLPELIMIAGMRWTIEEDNEHGKDLLGLDQCQVRKWIPWHRHVTTCMLALAFLSVARARLPEQSDRPGQPDAIPGSTPGHDQGKAPTPRERAC